MISEASLSRPSTAIGEGSARSGRSRRHCASAVSARSGLVIYLDIKILYAKILQRRSAFAKRDRLREVFGDEHISSCVVFAARVARADRLSAGGRLVAWGYRQSDQDRRRVRLAAPGLLVLV